eukprot:scaffold1594_cov401-Prasinococcus_capsulatus_cf.AAC.46
MDLTYVSMKRQEYNAQLGSLHGCHPHRSSPCPGRGPFLAPAVETPAPACVSLCRREAAPEVSISPVARPAAARARMPALGEPCSCACHASAGRAPGEHAGWF